MQCVRTANVNDVKLIIYIFVKPFKKSENPSKTTLLIAHYFLVVFIKMLNVEKYLDMRI